MKFISILISFSLGIIVSGAIFSFIAMIGVVPRLAQKTKTTNYIKFYEEVIIFAGIWGATTFFIDYKFILPKVIIFFLSICNGIFLGCLAVSLTEVLDVIPILTRRGKVASGLKFFMLAISLGKGIGTLIYYFLDII